MGSFYLSLMKQKVYQLSLITKLTDDVSVDLIFGVLCSAGFSIQEIVEDRGRKSTSFSFYVDDKKSVDRIKGQLKKLKIKGVSLLLKPLLAETWINAWKDNFKPFRLTKKFDIVPFSHRNDYIVKKDRFPIVIDTSLAFGTGMHETTQFVARCIERCQNRFDRFLDIGTGTGILTLVALGCGIRDVHAFDICPDAIKIANENFRLNGFDDVVAVVDDVYQLQDKKKYDFVAANLVTHDLLAVKRTLVKLVAEGKYLALSGISLAHYKKIREGFKNFPLKCIKIERGREWVALLFKKRSA